MPPFNRVEPKEDSKLVWISSYFKSGNTWTRLFLASYFQPKQDASLLNYVSEWASLITAPPPFDYLMGIPSALLQRSELVELRAAYHDELARCLGTVFQGRHSKFFKTHDAFIRSESGRPLFSKNATECAIYLVRNPLDAAVSFANFTRLPVSEIIPDMNQPRQTIATPTSLPIEMLRWSEHVTSWVDQTEFPVLTLRYEDMLADPRSAFLKVLNILGETPDLARLETALSDTSFTKLKDEEEKKGFGETPTGVPAFFNKGKSGQWRSALTPAQIESIVKSHGPTMRRFGYLDIHGDPI